MILAKKYGCLSRLAALFGRVGRLSVNGVLTSSAHVPAFYAAVAIAAPHQRRREAAASFLGMTTDIIATENVAGLVSVTRLSTTCDIKRRPSLCRPASP